ncbi:hypothetical protein ZHAS_00022100 [Anopheles sinensis]|uniref:Uncharacterized protein n=1 Tax=Anopheles sinensis TaxID=74873 RepID=A0A084WU28_ANOSI|nr:hypothetical protein ZHAS_00022100 [Anopheles sinensis]
MSQSCCLVDLEESLAVGSWDRSILIEAFGMAQPTFLGLSVNFFLPTVAPLPKPHSFRPGQASWQ